jgi:protein-S-isoprenylcysteine O-methyltransferase Ste14
VGSQHSNRLIEDERPENCAWRKAVNINTGQSTEEPNVSTAIRKRMVQVFGNLLLVALILFAASGRLGWVWAWLYVGVGAALLVVNALVLLPSSPELVAERSRVAENTKGWDRVAVALLFASGVGIFLMAGLDERFGWSPALALMIHVAALVATVLAQAVFTWAMASNRFFAKTVRIQEERAHAVARGGPYRFVRHPGYAANIITMFAVSLLLGSLWALIPATLSALAFIVRTALEDRTLQRELDGYADYARQVRYRLLPRVW